MKNDTNETKALPDKDISEWTDAELQANSIELDESDIAFALGTATPEMAAILKTPKDKK